LEVFALYAAQSQAAKQPKKAVANNLNKVIAELEMIREHIKMGNKSRMLAHIFTF